jgi:hypothetical protein
MMSSVVPLVDYETKLLCYQNGEELSEYLDNAQIYAHIKRAKSKFDELNVNETGLLEENESNELITWAWDTFNEAGGKLDDKQKRDNAAVMMNRIRKNVDFSCAQMSWDMFVEDFSAAVISVQKLKRKSQLQADAKKVPFNFDLNEPPHQPLSRWSPQTHASELLVCLGMTPKDAFELANMWSTSNSICVSSIGELIEVTG